MTNEQALHNLDTAVALLSATRADHVALAESVRVLKGLIDSTAILNTAANDAEAAAKAVDAAYDAEAAVAKESAEPVKEG